MEKKNTNLSKKLQKIHSPPPHLADMNNEFTTAWRGKGLGYL